MLAFRQHRQILEQVLAISISLHRADNVTVNIGNLAIRTGNRQLNTFKTRIITVILNAVVVLIEPDKVTNRHRSRSLWSLLDETEVQRIVLRTVLGQILRLSRTGRRVILWIIFNRLGRLVALRSLNSHDVMHAFRQHLQAIKRVMTRLISGGFQISSRTISVLHIALIRARDRQLDALKTRLVSVILNAVVVLIEPDKVTNRHRSRSLWSLLDETKVQSDIASAVLSQITRLSRTSRRVLIRLALARLSGLITLRSSNSHSVMLAFRQHRQILEQVLAISISLHRADNVTVNIGNLAIRTSNRQLNALKARFVAVILNAIAVLIEPNKVTNRHRRRKEAEIDGVVVNAAGWRSYCSIDASNVFVLLAVAVTYLVLKFRILGDNGWKLAFQHATGLEVLCFNSYYVVGRWKKTILRIEVVFAVGIGRRSNRVATLVESWLSVSGVEPNEHAFKCWLVRVLNAVLVGVFPDSVADLLVSIRHQDFEVGKARILEEVTSNVDIPASAGVIVLATVGILIHNDFTGQRIPNTNAQGAIVIGVEHVGNDVLGIACVHIGHARERSLTMHTLCIRSASIIEISLMCVFAVLI